MSTPSPPPAEPTRTQLNTLKTSMDSYYTEINSTTRVKTCTYDKDKKQIVLEYKFDNGGSAKAKIELLEYDNWQERIQDVQANRSTYAA